MGPFAPEPSRGAGRLGPEFSRPEHKPSIARLTCCATNGCEHSQQSNTLLDHLVGACEHRRRQIQSERPDSLQVNGQVELGRTLDR